MAIKNLLTVVNVTISRGPSKDTVDISSRVEAKVQAALSALDEKPEDVHSILEGLAASIQDPSIVSGIAPTLLAMCVDTHQRVYNVLIAAGIDRNFWSGIELA